jgi:universal stress protein A
MSDYNKILVAVDVYAEEEVVLKKALKMANKPTDVSLIYVTMSQVYFEPYGGSFGSDVVGEIREEAEARLKKIANEYAIPQSQTYVTVGSPADEIHQKAKELKADLIVIGTHGKSGLRLLLGSTANAVLHGVKCDVLAVKV